MAQQSAGLLAYRLVGGEGKALEIRAAGSAAPGTEIEVLLAHPGGPYWAKKDAGAWSVPKGLFGPGEAPLDAALREFAEETGFALAEIAQGEPLALGAAAQPSGKTVHVWAVRADLDPTQIRSNTFEIEWPPKSGRKQEFPEVDRAAWFPLAAAEGKILEGQRVFLSRLAAALGEEAAAVGDEPGPSGRRRP